MSEKQAQAEQATPSLPTPNRAAKGKPGAGWKENEQHILPKNRIGIVFLGLCCCIFLAAIDQVLST
jgi:hypothetical protein